MKGQVATEFFIYTSIFIFMAIAAFLVVNNVQSSEIPLRENTVAKETGDFFASSLTLAAKGGSGFTYNYSFPKTILGTYYTLTFSNNSKVMILDWEGRYGKYSQSYPLPPYKYAFGSGITADSAGNHIFNSADAGDMLTLFNDGENLTISHGGP